MEQLLNSEETELCKILSLALHGKKSFDTDRKIDWNALIQMAEKHKVLPFLFDILQGADLPQEQQKILQKKGQQTVQQSYRLLFLSKSIIEELKEYGIDAILLKGSGAYLKVSDFPTLKTLKGRTLITTDGTTLLGADDKAGVSEIMTAVEQIITEKIPHGDIWIGFTPDEEVGSGADLFDLDYFKAKFAYTVDGDYEGEVAYENFNAASASFEINGVNVHPGEAKDIMINAALVGCEITSLLPENETPAHTEGREGFYHLTDFSGDIAHAKVNYIVRDHDKATFEKRLDTLRGIEKKMNEKYHADTVKLNIQHSYSNMLEVIEKNEYVVAIAKKAIKNVGLEPVSRPVRGGTDGARLSFMGLPCPNLGTGGYGFHGPFEHISVEGMDTAVSVIKEIVKITAE